MNLPNCVKVFQMINTVEYLATFVYSLQILLPNQLVMLQALSAVKVDIYQYLSENLNNHS
jgi:hypothetical protein